MSLSRGPNASLSILVVTQHEADLESIREALSGEDWTVVGAGSQAKALRLLESPTSFGAVIVDLDAAGFEPIRLVNEIATHGRVPVIVLGASGTAAVEQALDAGAFGFVPRPMTPDLVRAWLGGAGRVAVSTGEAGERPACRQVLERFAKLSHDVNNPIQALYATADMLGFKLPPGSKEVQRVEKIVGYARQVAEIVADASLLAKTQLDSDVSGK
ncbi:MAG TPA: response regulator [Candidatus Hydrogenedentes bacterium]|nr:response regulator [Candidatus Hydrogenedentota bacterium]HPG68450.1 response regulator [Candidatus Hydrogenedentota bacterium]